MTKNNEEDRMAQDAVYHHQTIQEYMNNPLIEALPPISTEKEVIKTLGVYPTYNCEERYLDKVTKSHLLQRISRYFQPLPVHLDIYSSIDRLLRLGYVSRNPLSTGYTQSFHDHWKQGGEINGDQAQAGSKTLSIIGVSGMGKTRTIERVLECMPQLIQHTEYQKQPLMLYQVTYLVIQTPFDGSVKSIIFDFMHKVDQLMGTQYFQRYAQSRLSTSQLMPIIKNIATSINLGMLIIDEIQHLKSVKTRDSTRILNFFTTLINTLDLPLVMIGTPKAMDVLQAQFRQSRRSVNVGNVYWDRMQFDDEWRLFMEGLWAYQWTEQVKELDERMLERFYEETQGIPDIAIKLYMMMQLRAISSGKEKLDLSLLNQTAKEDLKMLQPTINALKREDYKMLVDQDDVLMTDIEDKIQQTTQSINRKERMTHLQDVADSEVQKKELVDEALWRLTMLGYSEDDAYHALNEVITEDPSLTITNVVQKAYDRLRMSVELGKQQNQSDLRDIISSENQSHYEELVQAGVIKSDY